MGLFNAKTNPLIKLVAIPLIVLVLGITALSLLVGHIKKSETSAKTPFISDKASGDTPVETLKTLTAEISTVEQQNKKIVEQNKTLTQQDQETMAQLKSDVMGKVQQQLDQFKTQTQASQLANKNNPAANDSDDKKDDSSDGQNLTWVTDMQSPDDSDDADNNGAAKNKLASLLNPATTDKDDNSSATTLLNNSHKKTAKPPVPYYTIPVNATLTGAIAMQPIIGRIPINGKVPDPYTFKVILGAKNLAANGIDIPSDLQGIVASGVAEGDLLGQCARGDIRAMTFVFDDGRISTTEAKEGKALGTIAAANGNPCIQGSFHTDAPLFLGVTAGLAGVQGYGNALAQAQLNNVTTSEGSTISSLMGNANTYAFGQGFSAASQAAQQWWNQRVQSSFDFVYVPNVDLKTGEKLKLNINITQEIPIDYDPQGRKVFYAHDTHPYAQANLD